MKRLVPIMAASLALGACGGAPTPAPPAPAGPKVHMPAVPGRPASGYFTLRISGDRGALLSVTSPQAGRIEMHETMSAGTMTSMRPIARLPVRDGETLSFAPGGRHLMIYDLRRDVAAGSPISLVLHFERGPDETLSAVLVPTGGDVGP